MRNKKIQFVLILIILFALVGCASSGSNGEDNKKSLIQKIFSKPASNESNGTENKNTVTEKTIEEPVPNDSKKLMASIELDNDIVSSKWESKHYVDEFKQPTEEAYVGTVASGTFSNSATSNSPSTIMILAEEDNFAIQLTEYNYGHQVTLLSFEKAYIKVRTEDGNIIKFDMSYTSNGGKRLVFNDTKKRSLTYDFYSALVSNKTVQIYVSVYSDYSSSSYLYTIPCKGFAEAYHKAFLE